MTERSYRLPPPRSEVPISLLLGAAFAALLFVLMALAQMLGEVTPPNNEVVENLVAFEAPEIVEVEEEEPPPPEEEEPPPQLEKEPPQLTLDQLDIALNPGTGGALAGDFSMPSIGSSAADLGTEDFVDFSNLDQMPRPVGVSGFDFPRRLRKKKANGRVVLMIQLNDDGRVMNVEVDSSTLPAFNSFIQGEVKKWRFTPPTQQGRPVKAQARLPIPINIK